MNSLLHFRLLRNCVFSLAVILCLLPTAISAQWIRFQTTNLLADNAVGNWMIDYDNPGMQTDDGNAYTFSNLPDYQYHKYANLNLHPDSLTNTAILGNCLFSLNLEDSDITLNWGNFRLIGFQKFNSADPTLPWNTPGQSAVKLTYLADSMSVSYQNVPKLLMRNARLSIYLPYPDQAQINALGDEFLAWTGNLGTGDSPEGSGSADIDVEHSDPAWVHGFNWTNSSLSARVSFNITSMQYTDYQDYSRLGLTFYLTGNPDGYGYFEDSLYQITPSHSSAIFAPYDLLMIFGQFAYGGANADLNDVYLNYTIYPIELPCKTYWSDRELEFTTTLEDFNVSLTFYVDGSYSNDINDYRVLYKPAQSMDWQVWEDYQIFGSNNIQANNVNVQGYFALPARYPYWLDFTAEYYNHTVVVDWNIEYESGLLGYNVYHSETNDLSDAVPINPALIPATNNAEPQTYSFIDRNILPGTTYYWLDVVYTESIHNLFGPVHVFVPYDGIPPQIPESRLIQIYPNPSRQGMYTKIEVSVKTGETGLLTIFNSKGQTVEIINISEGNHIIQWDASHYPSGVYFYRLKTPSVNQVKKLVLLK